MHSLQLAMVAGAIYPLPTFDAGPAFGQTDFTQARIPIGAFNSFRQPAWPIFGAFLLPAQVVITQKVRERQSKRSPRFFSPHGALITHRHLAAAQPTGIGTSN